MNPTPPEVRAARGFVRQKLMAGTADISPRHFASASKELGVGFNGLATVLARLYSGGQNENFYREEAVESAVRSGQ